MSLIPSPGAATATATTTTGTATTATGTTTSSAPTSSAPSSAGPLKFAGINIAGFDFGCNSDGSCTASAAWPPLTKYYGASARASARPALMLLVQARTAWAR